MKEFKTTNDIIFALGISNLVLSIQFISYGIYYGENAYPPFLSGNFCQVIAYLAMAGAAGDFIYNCAYITLLM